MTNDKRFVEYNGKKYYLKEDQENYLGYQLGNIGLTSLENIKGLEDSDNLEYLDLSYNKLISLSESICEFKALKFLYLSENQLTYLPDCIHNLKSLELIELRDNRLNSLPDSIGKLKNLVSLLIDGNPLKNLPESIGSLKSLEFLTLFDTKLEVIMR